jgi:hypothetical protein
LRINQSAPLNISNYKYYLTKFQNRLIIIEEERSNNTIEIKQKELLEAERKFDGLSRKLLVVQAGKSAVRKPIHPKPQYSLSTSPRLFKKWRSSDIEDGLSVGSIMNKIINKTIPSFFEAFCLLLRDYDNQVTTMRNKFIH